MWQLARFQLTRRIARSLCDSWASCPWQLVAALLRVKTHVTCRLTAKNRDQLRNPTLGNRVWSTFTFLACFDLLLEIKSNSSVHKVSIRISQSSPYIWLGGCRSNSNAASIIATAVGRRRCAQWKNNLCDSNSEFFYRQTCPLRSLPRTVCQCFSFIRLFYFTKKFIHDTIRGASLTCNLKLTWVSWIYRTEPTSIKSGKTE